MPTYYSSHNASGGGVGSIADPFTLQELLDNVDAGDLGLVMATGTYTPSATVDVDNASAVNGSNFAIIRGAAANGDDDGTVATISGTGLPASADLFNLNVDGLTIKFEGLRITAGKQYDINLQTTINAACIVFINCRIDGAASHGVQSAETSSSFIVNFINCEIDHNGGTGIAVGGIGRGSYRCINCKIHHNTGDGIHPTSGTYVKVVLIGNTVYRNGGCGILINGPDYNTFIIGNVMFGNTSDGLQFAGGQTINKLVILNNIFRSNGGYGINTNSGSQGLFAHCDFNCFHNNTSGAMDISTLGTHNVTSNPLFTSETDGSEDFSLQSGSPCLNVGLGYNG